MSLGKEKLRKKVKTSNTKMYNTFVGSFVTIAVKDLLGINNVSETKFANLMIGGLLLDECETFIYLGSPEGINAAIPKTQIAGIFIDADELMEQDEKIPPGTIRQ